MSRATKTPNLIRSSCKHKSKCVRIRDWTESGVPGVFRASWPYKGTSTRVCLQCSPRHLDSSRNTLLYILRGGHRNQHPRRTQKQGISLYSYTMLFLVPMFTRNSCFAFCGMHFGRARSEFRSTKSGRCRYLVYYLRCTARVQHGPASNETPTLSKAGTLPSHHPREQQTTVVYTPEYRAVGAIGYCILRNTW